MKRAIITGANGFLGSALAKELENEGVEVIKITRDSCSFDNVPKEIDVFYHFAWSGTSGEKRSDIELQLSNIKLACDMLEKANEIGAKRFVYSGSLMEYEFINNVNNGVKKFIDNDIYNIAKNATRNMLKVISSKLDIEYIETIISNVYGEGEKSQRFLNSTIKKMINNEELKFTPGNQLYDFIHINDAVRAFYLIGEKGINNKNYYIGNAEPKPLKEFIYKIKDVVNPGIEIKLGEIPFNGVSLTYKEFDTNSLFNDFKFVPKIGFEEGVERCKNFILKTQN